MGNRRKPPRPRRPRPSYPEPEIVFLPGACVDDPAEIEEMKRRTHDGVINATSNKRASGVTWHIIRGRDDCRRKFDEFFPIDGSPDQHFAADLTPAELADGRKQFHAFFDATGERAVLILAHCEVIP